MRQVKVQELQGKVFKLASLDDYLNKRGIDDAQMELARRQTRELVDAYVLLEARKKNEKTQVQVASTTPNGERR